MKRRKAQQQRGKKKKEKDRAQPSAVGEAEICGHAQPAETQSIEVCMAQCFLLSMPSCWRHTQ